MSVVNWPLRRLILSYSANVYARWVTGVPLTDLTGGFKCFRRRVLEAIDLDRVRSNGYSFQIEMNFHSWKQGYRIKEIPIVFLTGIVTGDEVIDGGVLTSPGAGGANWSTVVARLLASFDSVTVSSGSAWANRTWESVKPPVS